MDFTQSNSYATDAGTGQRHHLQAQAVPTAVSDIDINSIIWGLMELLKFTGIAGAQFDKAVPGTYTRIRDSVRRIAGNNVTTVTAAMSPYAVTAANAGMIEVDASAGAVVLNLPAANVMGGLLLEFVRTDTTANAVTINRAGADTIDGATSFTLVGQKSGRTIQSNGASAWRSPINTEASLAASGWQRLPSGLIVQWGATGAVSSGGSATFSFPVAFPTNAWVVVATPAGAGANATASGVGCQIVSNSQFTLFDWGGISYSSLRYVALGN